MALGPDRRKEHNVTPTCRGNDVATQPQRQACRYVLSALGFGGAFQGTPKGKLKSLFGPYFGIPKKQSRRPNEVTRFAP